MTYLVIERFHNGDAVPVYRRFRDCGRLMPDGLEYVASWITDDFTTCYQIMRCEERALLDEWMAAWNDVMAFEVHEVMTSAEAQGRIGPSLKIAPVNELAVRIRALFAAVWQNATKGTRFARPPCGREPAEVFPCEK